MPSTEPSRRITAYSTTSPCTRSLIKVGGYFGSTFLTGTGPDNSANGEVKRELLESVCNSEKFRIQLPVELFRLGMFTFKVYTFFDAKIVSGFAPGGSAAKSGGPVRSATSSLSIFGSGRVTSTFGAGAVIF